MRHYQLTPFLLLNVLLFAFPIYSQVPSLFENINYDNGYRKLKWGLAYESTAGKLGGETVTSVKDIEPTSEQNSKRTYREIVTTQVIDGVQFQNTYSFVDDKLYSVIIESNGPNGLAKQVAFSIIDKLTVQYGQATNYDFGSYVRANSWESKKVNIQLSFQDEFVYAGQTFPKSFTLTIASIEFSKLTKPNKRKR